MANTYLLIYAAGFRDDGSLKMKADLHARPRWRPSMWEEGHRKPQVCKCLDHERTRKGRAVAQREKRATRQFTYAADS